MRKSPLVIAYVFSAISCALLPTAEPVSAQDLAPGQLPALTAQWWQWGLSIPTSVNPLTDTTGQLCMVGQRGSIWFLAGNLSDAPAVTRKCSVPADKTLFFPVVNLISFSAPKGVCGSTGTETPAQLRADIKPIIDAATALSVTVDGHALNKNAIQRVQSDVFDVAIPGDNLFGGAANACPASIFSPAVDDGYYASVDPLKPGAHTIRIQAKSSSVVIDVTYDLSVAPVSLE